MNEKEYREYPHHLENFNIQNYEYLKIEFTLKEKIKFYLGIHNKYKFECWIIDITNIGYLGKLDLTNKTFFYKGKTRRF